MEYLVSKKCPNSKMACGSGIPLNLSATAEVSLWDRLLEKKETTRWQYMNINGETGSRCGSWIPQGFHGESLGEEIALELTFQEQWILKQDGQPWVLWEAGWVVLSPTGTSESSGILISLGGVLGLVKSPLAFHCMCPRMDILCYTETVCPWVARTQSKQRNLSS